MKKFWLLIEGPPGRQFATDRSLLAYMEAKLSKDFNLIAVGTIRSSATASENVNLDCLLDNKAGQVSGYFIDRSPLGALAHVYQVDLGTAVVELVFTGTVYGLRLDPAAQVSLQA